MIFPMINAVYFDGFTSNLELGRLGNSKSFPKWLVGLIAFE
jgi:hypothetical protein